MSGEKSVVIGCDDTLSLSRILDGMKDTTLIAHRIISVTRLSDLTGIIRSLKPDLIILCFRNNQAALSDIVSCVGELSIPLFCLTKDIETQTLKWEPGSIVFTSPFDHILSKGYLASRINSILLLREEQVPVSNTFSLANAAINENRSENVRNLSRYVLELDQKVDVLLKLKERITELFPHVDDRVREELHSMVNSIRSSVNDKKLWEDFKMYFEQTSPDFLRQLIKNYPSLTPIDLKYCCYLKMNMSNDDIKKLLGINQESVSTHKYRLKLKMSLPKDQDLRNYLRSIGQIEYRSA